MRTELLLIGITLIIVGIILLTFAFWSGAKVETRSAIVGFIGPIPIGFGTNKQILYVAIGLMIGLLLFYFILNFALRKIF